LRLTSKSKWDRIGKSSLSINDAIDDALRNLIRHDILEYYRKAGAGTFREITGGKIVETSVKLSNSTVYQVKLKAARTKRSKDADSNAKYSALRQSGKFGYR
jgi:flavin-binding protein dodecin